MAEFAHSSAILPWYVLGAALPILMVVAGLRLRGMARGVRVPVKELVPTVLSRAQRNCTTWAA